MKSLAGGLTILLLCLLLHQTKARYSYKHFRIECFYLLTKESLKLSLTCTTLSWRFVHNSLITV